MTKALPVSNTRISRNQNLGQLANTYDFGRYRRAASLGRSCSPSRLTSGVGVLGSTQDRRARKRILDHRVRGPLVSVPRRWVPKLREPRTVVAHLLTVLHFLLNQ